MTAEARGEILSTLATIRRESGGEPRIGCREVELMDDVLHPGVTWSALRRLNERGLITRSGGWVWITDAGMEEAPS